MEVGDALGALGALVVLGVLGALGALVVLGVLGALVGGAGRLVGWVTGGRNGDLPFAQPPSRSTTAVSESAPSERGRRRTLTSTHREAAMPHA